MNRVEQSECLGYTADDQNVMREEIGVGHEMSAEMETEKRVRVALRLVPGLGSTRLRELIAVFGSAQAAWEASSEAFSIWGNVAWVQQLLKLKRELSLVRVQEELEKKGIQTVIPEEGSYPRLLAELADAPPLLYYRGQLGEGQEALAFVGSRQATAYGKAAAEFLAKEAASRGVVIVSGLARGIDSAAHKGALAAKGVTWAFLGSGVDIVYPQENLRLAEEILQQGALISEFVPGTPPQPTHFPARNRLISGCARGVVVVEAAKKSGALITVDFALEQGREVFAVPGPIFSELSQGTHHLIRQGARIVDDIEDIWAEFPDFQRSVGTVGKDNTSTITGETGQPGGAGLQGKDRPLSLTSEQKSLLGILSDIPLHVDQITLQAPVVAEKIPLLLLELQLTGQIIQLPGQRYVISRY